MAKLDVREYSTFYKIPIVDRVNYRDFRIYMSTKDYYTKEYIPFGYIEDQHAIRVPKLPENMLMNSLMNLYNVDDVNIMRMDHFPYDTINSYKMKNEPKDEIQKQVINDVLRYFKSEHRCVVSLKTGQGKTYVATNLISKLQTRALILVKTNPLKEQWLQSFHTHTNSDNVIAINGSADLVEVYDSAHKFDAIISTHASMREFIKIIGLKNFSRFLLKKGIGIKVYDEFDLESQSMFTIDTHSAVRYNLYLSATDYKSSNDEQKIFKRIFLDVPNVGKEHAPDIKRNALFCLYDSKPSNKEKYMAMIFTREGPTFNYQKYHHYMVVKKAYVPIIKSMWDNFIKERYNAKETLKTVFFIGRKTTAQEFKKDLLNITGLGEDDISILNSDVAKKDRENAMSKKIIISTSDSLGRGIDLKGLDTVVDLETRNSKSETVQVIGRVSRTGMTNVGTYIQLIDTAFETVKRNFETKMKYDFFDDHFTDMKVKEYF